MRMMLRTVALLILCLPISVGAAVHLVNPDGSGDFATIQDAIDASSTDDTIQLGDGVFTGAGNRNLLITRSLRFESVGGDPALCVIDAESDTLAFLGDESAVTRLTFDFQGISFLDGIGMWAEDNYHGMDLSFLNCRFEACAGIFFLEDDIPGGVPSLVDLENCKVLACVRNPIGSIGTLIHVARIQARGSRFEGNEGIASGNALLLEADSLTIENCDFYGNVNGGGTVSLVESGGYTAPNGEVIVTDCRFVDNTAGNCVEAFGVNSRIERCRFTHNSRDGVRVMDPGVGSTAEVRDCLFSDNEGYAIVRNYTSLDLEGCSFIYGGHLGDVLLWADDGDAYFVVDRCIFAHRPVGVPVISYGGLPIWVNVTCSNLYGNADGNGLLGAWLGMNENFEADPIFCDWPSGDFTLFETSPCLPANNACGVLIGSEGQGCSDPTDVDAAPGAEVQLFAHPNPFNPKTRIHFTLPAAGAVTLTVHDASGRRVAMLLDGELREAGAQSIDWQAEGLSSGVYLARLSHDAGAFAEKLVLLR